MSANLTHRYKCVILHSLHREGTGSTVTVLYIPNPEDYIMFNTHIPMHKHTVTVVMDCASANASFGEDMPATASLTISASHKTVAYAAMSAGIKMFAMQHNVNPQSVRYASTWFDAADLEPCSVAAEAA